jgi:hypothetical protein
MKSAEEPIKGVRRRLSGEWRKKESGQSHPGKKVLPQRDLFQAAPLSAAEESRISI